MQNKEIQNKPIKKAQIISKLPQKQHNKLQLTTIITEKFTTLTTF